MNKITLPIIKFRPNYIFPALFLSLFAFSLAAFGQTPPAPQQASLSLADLLVGLRSKKATLPERNTLLTDAVKKRGITFSLTPEIEKELSVTGADNALIQAVREKSVIVKISAPKPEAPAPPKAPDFAFYQNRANAHFVKGEFDLAVINYNKVIELNPSEPSTYMSRGLAFYNKEYFDKAVVDYGKVIELAPEDSAAYFKRAESYEKMKEMPKALADYQKAFQLDAKNTAAQRAFQRIEAEQARLAPPPTPKSAEKPAAAAAVPQMVNVGSLKETALKLAIPVYPSAERIRKTQGLVTVTVTIDEEGKVTEADATDGPAGLRGASEEAARKSKFKPVTVENKPVKAKGYITYNFKQ